MRCLVTGATGYVGGRLVPRLLTERHTVRCLARSPSKLRDVPWADRVEIVRGDVLDSTGLHRAMRDVDVVYYLVHSLARPDFQDSDRVAAELVAHAAADAGVARIVYLGGLRPAGEETPSCHLASRAEVGDIFLRSAVPTVVLQAGMITGAGSTSFEILRHLTDRLPVTIIPQSVANRTQPIAIADVLRYLLACATLPREVNRSFDIGGPDVLSYLDVMQRYARIAGLPRRLVLPVPGVPPALSAWVVALLTPVPRALAKPLIESLGHDLVCRERDIAVHVPDPPGGLLDYEQAVRRALPRAPAAGRGPRDPEVPHPTDPLGADGPVYTQHWEVATDATAARLWQVIEGIGGDRGWHTLPLVFELRGWIDQLLGGVGAHRGRRDPQYLRAGEVLDWWRVEDIEPGRRLLLRAEMRMPGTAWLQLGVRSGPDGIVTFCQDVTFAPAGLAGHLYWWAQRPAHDVVFR
ncbi:MAG: SDR family oxidoreductase, partial [Pseudonocardiaceae bacterium]